MLKKRASSPVRLLSGESKKEEKEKLERVVHKSTHVDHHDDGSMMVRHTPRTLKEGASPSEEVSYAVKDLDELHDGLEEHLGDPNDDEEEKT